MHVQVRCTLTKRNGVDAVTAGDFTDGAGHGAQRAPKFISFCIVKVRRTLHMSNGAEACPPHQRRRQWMMANDPMWTTVALKCRKITGTRNRRERRIPSQFINARVCRACMNATDIACARS